jgi:hypothetical protein
MLKIAEGINLDELEKYGFEKEYIVSDWCYRKDFIDFEYKENIVVWCDSRELQVEGAELLDTLYDLIQAGIVVKE